VESRKTTKECQLPDAGAKSAAGPPAARDPQARGRGAEGTVSRLSAAVLADWPAVDPARAADQSLGASDAVLDPERAAADGAAELQHSLPLVRGPGNGRQGLGPDGVHEERARLLRGQVDVRFFEAVLEQAREKGLLSEEHFTVDGTLIEAWASQKSFQPKDRPMPPSDDPGNPSISFRGQKRTNETHESKTDPQSRLFRKARGHEAKLCYMGHVLMENRNGLAIAG